MFGEGILTMCEVAVYSRVGSFADLCQLDNGGCSQVCYNLCNLRVRCGCWPGYTLAYDGITCVDKDECRTNSGGCDISHGYCINTPGSYHCACKLGYQLKENSEFVCE
ncbi:signal peptide, CUB and EGF-like domain-containing protein 2, partial [Stylophora pistillata]|uniref:signal peptide, CUB and EGF-like domain-containing protein 2 n=1 Tax=Stylophora pistillata TaxID=50429 RepID=UPI000C041588